MKNTFELSLSKEGEKIRICANERPALTLKQCEHKEVSFHKVERLCEEILSILNRANIREDVAKDPVVDLKKTGQDLFDELLTPKAKKSLLSSSCDSLAFEIDDKLVYIPWELLYDGQQFLCRRFNTGRIVTTKHDIGTAQDRQIDHSLKMLVISDPQDNLEAAYNEGIKIRDEFAGREESIKVNLVSRKMADTQFARRNIRDFDIVHFTGHAEYDNLDPSQSGWLLSDGKWTASDINSIKGDTPFPFLVFSNGCHSGHTQRKHIDREYEREIFDLANTFLHCGVTHYIGTFLEVQDASGSAFAVEFYRALREGIPVGEAVRAARKLLVERFGENNIIWASYMLYGDPAHMIPYKEKPRRLKTSITKAVLFSVLAVLILLSVYIGINDFRTTVTESMIPEPAALSAPLKVSIKSIYGLSYENEFRPLNSYKVITRGSRIHLYDKMMFSFSSNKDAYIYAVSCYSGRAPELLESIGLTSSGVEQGVFIKVENLRLDSNSGAEAIYILALETEVDDLDSALDSINQLHNEKKTGNAATIPSEFKIVSHIEISDGRVKSIN